MCIYIHIIYIICIYIYIHRFYRLLGCTSSFHTRPESWELMILRGFFSAARGILEVRGSHAEKEDLYHDISSIYYFNSFKTQCYCLLMISDDPWFASQFPIFSDLGWLGWSKADVGTTFDHLSFAEPQVGAHGLPHSHSLQTLASAGR